MHKKDIHHEYCADNVNVKNKNNIEIIKDAQKNKNSLKFNSSDYKMNKFFDDNNIIDSKGVKKSNNKNK